jgi:V8-like Glu-specific endopeptidase
VFRDELRAEGANSLRLRFGATNLPPGSELRLTGLRDGAVQRFDAASLRDWNSWSAVFNGEAVVLELRAGPSTRANRVVVTALEVGLPVAPVPVDDLCGPDDRVPGPERRVGRQYPYGCSVWLANEFTVVTAGHCTSDPNQQVHFEIPPSSSTGTPVFPPPEHQYPYEVATVQRLDVGPGADWTVARAAPNSNTGLYPGQSQGWFELGLVPSTPSGSVAVAGYGVVSDPSRASSSQTLQIDVGPLAGIGSDRVFYTVDTTAGSSGSPVVDVGTGRVIGVHTHGNCAFTGNIGTRIDRADFLQALTSILASKVLGRVEAFGVGCATSGAAPELEFVGYPAIGQRTDVQLGPVPGSTAAALVIGSSRGSWAGLALPAPIPGWPSCSVFVAPETSVAGPAAVGSEVRWSLDVPGDPALVGIMLGVQGFAVDVSGPAFSLLGSGALWMTVGRDV